ncbi:MAG: hypothetical protein ACPGYL_04455, partial [Rhodospirillaceae bacterium]
VRAVSQGEARLKEAAKLGFATALTPTRPKDAGGRSKKRKGEADAASSGTGPVGGLSIREIGHVQDLVDQFGGAEAIQGAAAPGFGAAESA